MEIIVPAAGLSRRFPNTKPKYLLFGYDGVMMLHKALAPYLDNPDINITIGILKEHDEKFSAREFIERELGGKVAVVVLPELTKGPADTVMQIIKHAAIEHHKPLLIKDCDSYFQHDLSGGNYVCVSRVNGGERISSIRNKSFIVTNKDNIIQHIIEKEIVSDAFCVGGYKFESVEVFASSYAAIQSSVKTEVYVSHVIEYAINCGHVFLGKDVAEYTDVGTLEEWLRHNNKPTIFCDIDGTIITAQGRWGNNNYSSTPIPLPGNIDVIKHYQKNGSQIIFTTSRPVSAKQQTIDMLNSLGFTDYQLLVGLNISSRILINDYNASNPYPSATAINIKRNSDNLGDFLRMV